MHNTLNFLRDERGSQTIEFVLWIPIIGALMVLITDAFLLYMTHTEMWNVARDTARRMTTGDLSTKAAAETYAGTQLTFFEYPYTVTATYDEATAMQEHYVVADPPRLPQIMGGHDDLDAGGVKAVDQGLDGPGRARIEVRRRLVEE